MLTDVVCNASPLIFIVKIRRLDLLDTYHLHIPSQVEDEIIKGIKRKKEDAILIAEYLKKRKIFPIKTAIIKNLPDSLCNGEKAVISLAIKKKIERVLIDEAKAMTVARFKGLKPKGTLGILWDSYKTGKTDRKTL